MSKGGRPTKYEPKYNHLAYQHCKIGAKDSDLAELLEVSESTVNLWKEIHPLFSESLNKGKAEFDKQRVEGALIHSAVGYSHKSEKIFLNKDGEIVRAETTEHYPPHPTSLIFWLKNRGDNWKDKQELDHSGSIQTSAVLEISFGSKNKD